MPDPFAETLDKQRQNRFADLLTPQPAPAPKPLAQAEPQADRFADLNNPDREQYDTVLRATGGNANDPRGAAFVNRIDPSLSPTMAKMHAENVLRGGPEMAGRLRNGEYRQALIDASLAQEQAAAEAAQEQAYIERYPTIVRPVMSGLRQLAAAPAKVVLAGAALAGSDKAQQLSVDLSNSMDASGQGQVQAAVAGGWNPALAEGVSGATNSLGQMVLIPGGAAAKVIGGSVSQGVDSTIDAFAAGKTGWEAAAFGLENAAAEAGPGLLLNRLGLGGLEKFVAGEMKASGRGFVPALRMALAVQAQEQPEELITTLAQQGLRTQIDPHALDPDQIIAALGQTVLQTAIAGGAATAPRMAKGLGQDVADATRSPMEVRENDPRQMAMLAALSGTPGQGANEIRVDQNGKELPSPALPEAGRNRFADLNVPSETNLADAPSAAPAPIEPAPTDPAEQFQAVQRIRDARAQMRPNVKPSIFKSGPTTASEAAPADVANAEEADALATAAGENQAQSASVDATNGSIAALRALQATTGRTAQAEQDRAALGRLIAEQEDSLRESVKPDAASMLTPEERQAREKVRSEAYLLREDMDTWERSQKTGEAPVGHKYDDQGGIVADELVRNRVADLGMNKAKETIRQTLGEKQTGMDDPTLTMGAKRLRRQEADPIDAPSRTQEQQVDQLARRVVASKKPGVEFNRLLPSGHELRMKVLARVQEMRAPARAAAPGPARRPVPQAELSTTQQALITEENDALPPAPPVPPPASVGVSPSQAGKSGGGGQSASGAAVRSSSQAGVPSAGVSVEDSSPVDEAGARERHGVSHESLADAPGSGVVSAIENTPSKHIDSTPTSDDDAKSRQWKLAMPTFQGGKQKMASMVVAALRRIMGTDANRITEVQDLFGGGGSWGLYLAMTIYPNARKLQVREFDADRLLKIKLFHDRGDQFAEIARSSGALAIATDLYQGATSAGGLAGRIEQALRKSVNLSSDARAVLAALRDYGKAAYGKRSLESIVEMVAGHAAGSRSAASAFSARGGAISYDGGSSYDAAVPEGAHVAVVADPPYYGTTSYNENEGSGAKVDANLYAQTAALMERLSKQGNSVVYTDEAWWNKSRKSGEADVPPDHRQGMPILGRIFHALDHFDVASRLVAGRWETLGVINGFKRNQTGGNGDRSFPDARPRVGAAKGVGADHTGGRSGHGDAGSLDVAPAVEGQAGSTPAGMGTGEPTPSSQSVTTAEPPRVATVTPSPEKTTAAISKPHPAFARLQARIRAVVPGATVTQDGNGLLVLLPGRQLEVRIAEGTRYTAEQIVDDAKIFRAYFDSLTATGDVSTVAAALRAAGLPSDMAWLKKNDIESAYRGLFNMSRKNKVSMVAAWMPTAAVVNTSQGPVEVAPGRVKKLIQITGLLSDTNADARIRIEEDLIEEFHHIAFDLMTDQELEIARRSLVAKGRSNLATADLRGNAMKEALADAYRSHFDALQRAAVSSNSDFVPMPIRKILGRMADWFRTLFRASNVMERTGVANEADLHALVKSGKVFDRAAPEAASVTPVVSGKPASDQTQGPAFSTERAADSQEINSITVDGVKRSTLNSNGKPIAETEERIRNFWKWFGESRAVDLEDRPQIYYHGNPTRTPITVFMGGFFTTDKERASSYTETFDPYEFGTFENVPSGSVYPVYLKIERPSRMHESDASGTSIDDLVKQGRDGIMGPGRGPNNIAIVTSPSQVKSATGNRGTFDQSNSDMGFATARSPEDILQGIRNSVSPEDVRHWDQVDQEADTLLEDPDTIDRIRGLAEDGRPLNDTEQRALQKSVSRELDEAHASGNKEAWKRAVGLAMLDDELGTAQARGFAARRLDLSTPDGRRRYITKLAFRPPERYMRKFKAAKGRKAKEAVRDLWAKQADRIVAKVQEAYGVDLTDPRIGVVFNDAFAVERLASAVSKARGDYDLADIIATHWQLGLLTFPITWAKNLSGNAANLAWEVASEHLQAVMGSVIPGDKVDAATMGELGSFYKGLLVGFSKAWGNGAASFKAEHDVLEKAIVGEKMQRHAEMQGRSGSDHIPTLPGLRLLSSRPISFMDGFFKAWAAHAFVGAEAYRSAKAQGLSGDDLTTFVADVMGNPSTGKEWAAAYATARGVAFQSLFDRREGEKLEPWQRGLQAVNSLARSKVGVGRANIMPGVFVLPFFGTPLDILRQGARKIPPFQAISMIMKVVGGKYAGDRQRVLRDTSELIGGAITSALLAAIAGIDDPDKEVITGSNAEWQSGEGSAEREKRSNPPYSIQVPGLGWVSYRNIEPFASAVGPMVDYLKGNGISKSATGVFDQSFLSQLADFVDMTKQVVQGKKTGEQAAVRMGSSIVSGLTPYLGWAATRNTRKTMREMDDGFNSRRIVSKDASFTKQVGQRLLVTAPPPLSRDLYGRTIPTGQVTVSDLGWRMFGLDKNADVSTPYDDMLVRWNKKADRDGLVNEKGQSLSYMPQAFKASWKGPQGQITLTESEAAQFAELAGTDLLQRLSRQTFNLQEPTRGDIERFKKVKDQAGDWARAQWLAGKRPKKP